MLEIESVFFRYPSARRDVLRGFSLSLRPGATTAVMGLSGSGKSTLLNLLGLLWDKPLRRGRITYTGRNGTPRDYTRLKPSEKARLRRREFGFIFQSAYMISHFSCWQNIALPLAIQKVPAAERDRRVGDLLERADPDGTLRALAGQLAGEVSGGEAQRMGLLRAVIHNPQVLFADEPLSNLDPKNIDHMLQVLADWQSGRLHGDSDGQRTLVLVTHDIDSALRRADDVVVIHDGRIAGGGAFSSRELGPDRIKCMMICGEDCSGRCRVSIPQTTVGEA